MTMNKDRGCLIILEGPDGSGKSEQTKRLRASLEAEGYDVVRAAPFYDTKAGIAAREFFLNPENTEHTATTEVMFVLAAHYELMHSVILPAVREGSVVLMDRSWLSTVIYQGRVRGANEKIMRVITGDLEEAVRSIRSYEMTLLVDVETTKQRTRSRGALDRNELETDEFLQSIYDEYLKHVEANRNSVTRTPVDALRPIDEVEKDIRVRVSRFLDEENEIRHRVGGLVRA